MENTEPILPVPLPGNITKTQEFQLARVIAYHQEERAEWWTTLTQWAERSIPPDVSKESIERMGRWVGLAVYIECSIDRWRLPEERWLAHVSYNDNNAEYIASALLCLKTLDKWNADLIPDAPPLFLRHLYQVEEHPVIAFIQCLGVLALGRVADQAIERMWIDSPTAKDVIAYSFAKAPPPSIKNEITWDTSKPFKAILERDFANHKGWTDEKGIPRTSEEDSEAWFGISSGLENWRNRPITELLRASQEGWLIKSLQEAIQNKETNLKRDFGTKKTYTRKGKKETAEVFNESKLSDSEKLILERGQKEDDWQSKLEERDILEYALRECTPTEQRVAKLMRRYNDYDTVSTETGLSPETVRKHWSNILKRLKEI